MRALVYDRAGHITLEQRDVPRPARGQVLVRTGSCGLCHTDIDVLHGRYGPSNYPVVPGHEYAGTVEHVGADVESVRPGDRVVVDPNFHCGTCRACSKGRHNLCDILGAYGVSVDGGFADYSVVDATNVVPIGGLAFERAALAEPFGCVLNGLGAAGTDGVDDAVVFGAGPIGLLLGLALSDQGVRTISMVDVVDDRLAHAQSLGLRPVAAGSAEVDQLRRSQDLAVDATGNVAVAGRLVDFVANGGTALFFGVCPPDATIGVAPFELFRRQLTVAGSHSLNHNLAEAVNLVERLGDRLSSIVTHRLPLDEIPPFLDGSAPHNHATMKVQFHD